jgi:hypothetical protein
MRFGESVGRFHRPLDRSRRHRRCTVCGGSAFSWVLTNEGRATCTVCYQDLRLREAVLEPDNGGDLPWAHGVSDARVTVE